MATELVTFKLEKGFLKEIDQTVQKERYQNRTEFIRDSLRRQIERLSVERFAKEIGKFKGMGRGRKISEKEYEKAKDEAFEQLKRFHAMSSGLK